MVPTGPVNRSLLPTLRTPGPISSHRGDAQLLTDRYTTAMVRHPTFTSPLILEPMPPAGRPREFDFDVALDAAMEAFWHHGYGGTSMSDIEQATGLGKGSIYKAFGDKHTLFVQALERYLDHNMAQAAPRFIAAATATEAVRLFMEWAQERGVRDDGTRMGCMAINAITELAQDDEVVRGVLHSRIQKMIELMTALVQRGQQSGEFRTDVDAESLAEYLALINAGFVTHGKGGFPRSGSTDPVEIVMSALEAK